MSEKISVSTPGSSVGASESLTTTAVQGGIHPSAIVHPSAKIADNVEIGPWSFIGADVEIGEGTWIGPHVVINGPTKIGKRNKVYQFASVGDAPQDKKYNGERTSLEIGDDNVIREACTLNRGTVQGGGVTRIGHHNLLMANVHIAHDCQVGNETIFANNSALAGHVVVHDYVIFSGFTGVHQFCQIGAYSFISRGTLVTKDVPPYLLVGGGARALVSGINTEGLKRHGFSSEALLHLRRAFKLIYRKGLPLQEVITQLAELVDSQPELKLLVDFLQQAKRGIIA